MSAVRCLVLASASPRRRALLERLGVPFAVIPADVEEHLPTVAPRAERVARALARRKAVAVAAQVPPGTAVLAADTVVVLRGCILGKPADADEAAAMLRALRARQHRVITGVALAVGRRVRVTHAVTTVRMRAYGDDEIAASIAAGTPFDKAGAYAIQDPDFRPVASYRGCYCNVVGLPLAPVITLLREAGVAVPDVDPAALTPQCGACPLFAPVHAGAARHASH
ncbi:MAG: Maf family protein [Sphaerobacter sp.]|nr:Maf family protein [Sphaerobacter sp.]